MGNLQFLPSAIRLAFSPSIPQSVERSNPALRFGVPVIIGRVVGTVVSTQKHRKFEGAKLLLVQPLNMDGTPRGVTLLAVDGVGAGVHERVLIVLEGRAAGEAIGRKGTPVDAAIIGIVDEVDLHEHL